MFSRQSTYLGIAAAAMGLCESGARAALTWTTAVDQASDSTNQMRSIAVANDSVYVGFIQTTGADHRAIVRYDDQPSHPVLNSYSFSDSSQPKALAADDRGYLFAGTRDSGNTSSHLQVFSDSLAFDNKISTGSPNVGGLAIRKVDSTYYAYASYEGSGLIQRFDVTDPNSISLDSSFGTGGSFTVAGGGALRGMEVADDGTLFVADRDNNKLFKISADLSTVTSVTVASAQDVALYEGKLYVSSYAGTASKIAVLNASDLSFVQDIDITTLDGSAYSRANSEGFAGIDIDSTGHLWLLDENYGSAPGGVVRDRLLVSSAVPEPSTLGLLVLGGSALLMRRRRAIL